jgi:hypothetical protein
MTWFKERPIIVDPGLFSYEKGPERDFFEGTQGHNVVVIDGENQPETYRIGTTNSCVSNSVVGIISSVEFQNVEWTRLIALIENETLIVLDDVRGDGTRSHAQTWHFDKNLEVVHSTENEMILKENLEGIATVKWESMQGINSEIIQGREKPLQGWVIDAYESRVSAPVIELTQISKHLQMATVFQIGDTDAWNFSGHDNQMSIEINSTILSAEKVDNEWICSTSKQ